MQGDADREHTCGHSSGRRGWGEWRKQRGHIHTTVRKRDSWWGAAEQHRGPSSKLCDDLGAGPRRGGRLEREGIYV